MIVFLADTSGSAGKIDAVFAPVVSFLEKVFFWDPVSALGIDTGARVPIVVLWLILGGVFFTIRMKFVNFRAFRHAFGLLSGRYDKAGDRGEVSHFQALSTALSATVGLGNIAGVAIAVTVGGAGATFWMIVAGLLGMSMKFTECTLGLKYRIIDKDGRVSGGPMYYLSRGLKKRKLGGLGMVLAGFSAIMMVFASFGGSNMFQANQSFAQFRLIFPSMAPHGFWFGVGLAVLTGLVVYGGVQSIARVAAKLVPFMVLLYVGAALVIIGINIHRVGEVFMMIIRGAFSPVAVKGGVIGVLVTGFQRGAFSNEAGVGSAAVAHAAARTNIPVREGIVALLEPFIDTVVVCTMTSMVILFSGVSFDPSSGLEGTQLTSSAFATVFPWFPYLLVVSILCFAFSTMISWSYYGLNGFKYLFGNLAARLGLPARTLPVIYYAFFLSFTILGASSSLNNVIAFSDMMVLTMAFPNITGLFIMAPEVYADLQDYLLAVRKKDNVPSEGGT